MPEMTETLPRTQTERPATTARQDEGPRQAQLNPVLAWAGALLTLGVAWIHVIDQGGLPGSKDPAYVGRGYWALELVAVVVAVALIVRRSRRQVTTWLAVGTVAAGPLIGYVLSRGPGMPGYTDDRGNWAEPIGLISMAVEGLLLLLAVACIRILRSSAGATSRI